MTTAEYWRDRAEMVMSRGMAKADDVLRDLQKMYAQAARDVQAEIDKLYRMYAQESGLSYADAQAYLNRAERTEWRMTLAEYVDRINATGDKALLAELNALAAQSRVRRFRQVLTAIDVAASELRSDGEKLTEKLLRGAYRSAYRMAGDLLAGGTLEALNPASVAQALAYPWSGASFSDRIWSNAEQLAQTLRRTVTQGLIQGQDVRQMAAGVQKAAGAAMHRAETLIRTETARCIEDGTLAGYKAAGVERYQILVSPDSRTCDACARLDGAVFRVDEAVTGVNYPPFHPNCRDTTVPYFGDDELARWEQLGAGMAGGVDGQGGEELSILETGARKTTGWEDRHAERYYEEVRKREPYSDARRIARAVSEFSVEQIEQIRQHMFIKEQPRDGGLSRFDAGFDEAQAWQRLTEGINIRPSDIVLLQHEYTELTVMAEKGYTYDEAHAIANKQFDWWSARLKEE